SSDLEVACQRDLRLVGRDVPLVPGRRDRRRHGGRVRRAAGGVTMRAIRATFALLIVPVLVMVSVGCAGRAVPDLPDLPPVVEGVEQDVYAASAKALGVLTSAARLVDAISRVEDQAARQGLIPANADA